MGRTTTILLLLLLVARATADAPAPPLKEPIERALGWMQKTTLQWKADHNCATCHHAPMMLWSHYEAKNKGYTVDQSAVDTIRAWILADGDPARIVARKEQGDFYIFSSPSVYTTFALAASPKDELADAAVKRYRDHYLVKQEADGSFLINGKFEGLAPILEGGSNGTCLASLALGSYTGLNLTPEQAAAKQKADAWLAKPTDHLSQQEMCYRLLVAEQQDNKPLIEELAASLLSLQRPDGAWSQTPQLDGDAYATGQALRALGGAGMRAEAPPIADAIAFLTRTQLPDGSWTMNTRSTMNGTPEKPVVHNLEPITASGVGWATLGLLAVL